MSVLDVVVSADWERVSKDLGLVKQQLSAVVRTATRQAGQWANREGARGLAKATNVPLKVLREGVRVKFEIKSRAGKSTARLWYGINPIALKYLGAKQQKKGVTARGNTIKGAFFVGKLGANVFVRIGSERLPIVKQNQKISESALHFLEGFRNEIMEKFQALFFMAVDKLLNRESGTSASMSGGLDS